MTKPDLQKNWSKVIAAGAVVTAIGSVLPWAELSVAESAATFYAGDTIRAAGGSKDGLPVLGLAIVVAAKIGFGEETVYDCAVAAAGGIVTFGVAYPAYQDIAEYHSSLSGTEAEVVTMSTGIGFYLVLFGGFLMLLAGVYGVFDEKAQG